MLTSNIHTLKKSQWEKDREIGKELEKRREERIATIWQKYESRNLPLSKHQKRWLELFLSPDAGGRDDNSPVMDRIPTNGPYGSW